MGRAGSEHGFHAVWCSASGHVAVLGMVILVMRLSAGNDHVDVPDNEVTCIRVLLHFADPWVWNFTSI